MKTNLVGLASGVAFGLILAWAQVTDPHIIRAMLLLKEPDVFLLMGSAIVVAGIGVRVLKAGGLRSLVSGEAIGWSVERPRLRHVTGSMLFGLGWSVAGTCPGPLAAMVGEGRLAAAPVAIGLLAGVTIQRALTTARAPVPSADPCASPSTAGL